MRDPTVEIWSLDEVHFQQHGSRCRMWVPPETKNPVLFHHPTRKGVGYFGAVRIRDGKFVSQMEAEKFNAESFFEFMKTLRRKASRRHRVVVIADNARYHHANLHAEWRKKCGGRFELLFLPPYSPDLNPIERVWKLTRRQCLHNRYFPRLNDVVEAVEAKFTEWADGSVDLKRLCVVS